MKSWKSILLGAAVAAPAMAQLTTTQCPNGTGATLAAGDFQMTELFNRNGTASATPDPALSEPTYMDVQIVKEGTTSYSNIYFTERLGNVKMYDGKSKTVKVMGKISTLGKQDNGLMGIALHPDYDNNRWVYFWYSPPELLGQNRQLRLTRMVVKSDNTLDMASEKILISIKGSKTDTWHSGGPMTFDNHGDLWVAVGNNSLDLDPTGCSQGNSVLSKTDSTNSAEWGPSNTASLRGGFFRIHPDSSAKGYSIPRGNFGEYWSDHFAAQGNATLAAQYKDPLKVLPEVYVKGERSNYSIAVHPTKRWLAWGTVNYASNNDEFNITPTPAFSGFPYFHGNNAKTCTHDKTVDAPKNNNPMNSGVVDLPPAMPPLVTNITNVAIGGPIYTFDPSLDSPVKFPPHFHNKWIVSSNTGTGSQGGPLFALSFDTTTFKLTNQTKLDNGILNMVKPRNLVAAKFGKDGALYILNYDADNYSLSPRNPGAMKITYKGACLVPVTTGIASSEVPAYQNIRLSARSLKVGEKGAHTFSMYDLAGNRVFRTEGSEGAEYAFSSLPGADLKPGIYVVRVKTAQGLFVRQTSLL